MLLVLFLALGFSILPDRMIREEDRNMSPLTHTAQFNAESVSFTASPGDAMTDFLLLLPPEAGKVLPESDIDRKTLAAACGTVLGGAGKSCPADVPTGAWYENGAALSCDFDLFGSFVNGFNLYPDSTISRADAARLAVRLYAAITGIEEYQTDPGLPCGLGDMQGYSVEKQWYIYSAIYNQLLPSVSASAFEPARALTAGEAALMIADITSRCRAEGNEGAATEEERDENFRTVPRAHQSIAPVIDTIVFEPLSTDMRRLVTSIQGIVNRNEIRIMTRDHYNSFMIDYLLQKQYFTALGQEFTSAYSMLTKYIGYISGAVVTDPGNPYSINTATDIAGVENRIVISPSMISEVQSLGITDIKDLRGYNLSTMSAGQQWVYQNYWMFMRRDIMNMACHTTQYDYDRDYFIQMRIPTFFIPRNNEVPDYLQQQELVKSLLLKYPSNIPIVGFPPATDSITQFGLDEYDGVLLISQYGKYILPQDWVGNLSVHTCIPVPAETRKFVSKNNTSDLYMIPGKKYICLTMMDSGDAPAYIQYGFKERQWDDPRRGSVPFNYCYGFANYDLLPAYTEYFFSSVRHNDYLFSSLSGIGYMIPFANNFGASYHGRSEGFASVPPVDDDGIAPMSTSEISNWHYKKANVMMKKTGMTSQIMYSRGGGWWNQGDYDFMENHVIPNLTGMTSIMADIGRVVPISWVNPVVYAFSNRKPMFHCVTFWSYNPDFSPSTNPVFDEQAVEYTVNEIVQNTQSGNLPFYNCAVYSWQFSSRRVEMVKNRMEALYPGQYEFVTIDQLEALFKTTGTWVVGG